MFEKIHIKSHDSRLRQQALGIAISVRIRSALAFVCVGLFLIHDLPPAQAIPGVYTIGNVTTNLNGSTVEAVSAGTNAFYYETNGMVVTVEQPYDLNALITDSFEGRDFSNGILPSDFLNFFTYRNPLGTIVVTNQAAIALEGIWSASDNSLGYGAIQAASLSDSTGYNVSLSHEGNILVLAGSPWSVEPGTKVSVTTLQPEGFRAGNVNGIIAISSGSQTNTHATAAGGAVNVTTATGSIIVVTNNNAADVTTGISASSVVGTGNVIGTNSTDRTVTVVSDGQISVNAAAGIGIYANSTGVQIPSGGGTNAFGGNVAVTLSTNAEVTMTGARGIGVFGLSAAYMPGENFKGNHVQSGNVTIELETGSTLLSGETNSVFSMGILAMSAGSAAQLDPFHDTTNVQVSGVGNAGQAFVSNSGSIQTAGEMAIGVAALSIGGAGIVTKSTGVTGYSALGGSGATNSGNGVSASVLNAASGSIVTLGEGAHGIAAISSGSGGLIYNDFTTANTNSGLIIGNNNSTANGPASQGGQIAVTNHGSILTGDGNGGGNASVGLLAQSIGGGGGNAGGKHAAAFIGDKGGAGGSGGEVTVVMGAGSSLTNMDTNSLGILAQSIGGGGGNGANAAGFLFAVGGAGGSGGAGGTVNVSEVSGSIYTLGDHSAAIVAQSIGGGGGHGGGATALGEFISVGVGGHGGTGGAGGTVDALIKEDGVVTTKGNNSAGVILQSIGGGGGTGGSSSSLAAGVGLTINLALGGGGGGGGTAGNVTMTNSGMVTTGNPQAGQSNSVPNQYGADSIGILSQSIGGGGGHGGSAYANSVTFGVPDEVPAFNLTYTMGGAGGTASHGASNFVNNLGKVATWGDGSHGILAQSIGGGGGNGGDSTAIAWLMGLSTSNQGSVDIALGGRGGAGGNGGVVTVWNGHESGALDTNKSIFTYGQNAAGLVAQSLGGGGGNGAIGNAEVHSPPVVGGSNTYALALSLGGQSGSGGSANTVSVENNGMIQTFGSGSQGMIAQSIGGGGGTAGGGSSSAGGNHATMNVTVGGKGGSGGNGQHTEAVNWGLIQTTGGDAIGIMAQSIGGGGGNGGTSDDQASVGWLNNLHSNLATNSSGTNYTGLLSVGGQGGNGGAAGTVYVGNEKSISTLGSRSYGILAQSVSDGGGNGGTATADSNSYLFGRSTSNMVFSTSITVGGKGGAGHNATNVTIRTGEITTAGYGAHAVLAQSIAGGGGAGADGSIDTSANIGLGINVNGANGSSGKGGAVTVDVTGAITTTAKDAAGVVAQSIGGGGGLASSGKDFTAGVHVGVMPSLNASLTLGINMGGNDSSDGGAVVVNNDESIQTSGDWAHGILAQSIGGGGGKGSTIYGTSSSALPELDFKVGAQKGEGNGGAVTVDLGIALQSATVHTGSSTNGYGAFGVVLQSIGGGGGLATDASPAATGSMIVGGRSSDALGYGGAVELSGGVSGTSVSTEGDAAHAVIMQSIGGGGGIAANGSSTSSVVTTNVTTARVGGSSQANGEGGTVTFTNGIVAISTKGDQAYGLLAQSIGGGGGLLMAKGGTTNGAVLGGSYTGSKDANAKEITINLHGGIDTDGTGSHGLIAQSIGGGGGIVNPAAGGGLTTANPLTHTQTKGYGNNINLTSDADINVSGQGAYGVIAQSISGGGGLIGNFAGVTGTSGSSGTASDTGTINIDVTGGQILAGGSNGGAIFAQSKAYGTGGNKITVNITNNAVVAAASTGVWVDNGSSANIVTIGSGARLTSSNAYAVFYSGHEYLTVNNQGTLSGSVSLQGDAGRGRMTNQTAAVFNSGETVNAVLTDYGKLFVAGSNTVGSTTFEGNYTQESAGNLNFDIMGLTNYDSMTISNGFNGSFNGTITVNFSVAYTAQIGDRFDLIGGSNNMFDPNYFNPTYNGLQAGVDVQAFHAAGLYYLQVMAIPEPGTWMLILIGILLLALTRPQSFVKKG